MAVESAPVTLVDSSLAFCIDDQAVPEARQPENSLSRSCYWLGAPSFDFEGGSDLRDERSRKRAASGDDLQAFFVYERKKLQRGALRMLFSALPLADQARSHIQIGRKDSLARLLRARSARIFLGVIS